MSYGSYHPVPETMHCAMDVPAATSADFLALACRIMSTSAPRARREGADPDRQGADMTRRILARTEREALSHSLERLGPTAPTLLPSWQARDLLQHLLLRERWPHLMALSYVPGYAGLWAQRRLEERAALTWQQMVDLFRAGPPPLSPLLPVDARVNAAEHLVHHEDLLRAQPDWKPRSLSAQRQEEAWQVLRQMHRLLVRVPITLTLVAPQGSLRQRRRREHSVRVHGDPVELLLWAFGRDDVCVQLHGSGSALDLLAQGRRGF